VFDLGTAFIIFILLSIICCIVIGAVIGADFLLPFMTEYLIGCVLAFVAGIMVYISFDELLPANYAQVSPMLKIENLATKRRREQ